MVTGPSLTSDTCMSAPKVIVCISFPSCWVRHAMNFSYISTAIRVWWRDVAGSVAATGVGHE